MSTLHSVIRTAAATAAAVALLALAGCSSTPNYKSMTCRDWLKLANGSDLGKALQVASNLEESTGNVVGHPADYADTISGACGPTRLADVKIIDLRDQITSVFLSVHPEDQK